MFGKNPVTSELCPAQLREIFHFGTASEASAG